MKRFLPLLLATVIFLSACLSSCSALSGIFDRPLTDTVEGSSESGEQVESTLTETPEGDDTNGDAERDTEGNIEGGTEGELPEESGKSDETTAQGGSANTENGEKTDGENSDEQSESHKTSESNEPFESTERLEPNVTESDEGSSEKEGDTEKESTSPADPDVQHADKDDNGLCDDCGQSVIIILDMFAINDLHGKIFDSASQAGVDEMTTYIKNAYKNEDHVIVLSSGDMWQGSSESNLTKGLIVTEWMNELDFVSMTIGNHEFDWGEQYISANAAIAEFPFLAINIFDKDTNALAEYCTPSVIVERGGAKIGIIGAIGDCYSSISGEFSDGFYFKVGSDLTALVKAESEKLREAGADFIIYSLHGGYGSSKSGVGTITDSQLYDYYQPVLSEGYVDIVFEGHTHRSYVLIDGDGVYHMQNGGDNSGISQAEAKINFANGNSMIITAEYVPASVYNSLPDDPIVDKLTEKYAEQLADASRVLGMNDSYRDGDELRQIMSSLYLNAGLEAFGDEYDIVLGGGFFSVRSPGYLSAGQVTFSQIQMIFPFENTLVLCSIKGSDLLKKFINTTNSNYFITLSDYGNSIINNIDPNGTYYVITDTYSSNYASNRLTEIKRYTEGVFSFHLMADYIEAGGMTSGGAIKHTTIAEALAIGNALASGETTSESYYISGTVTKIESTTWGNLYIEDEKGNQIYVYGVYDETGTLRYDAMDTPPKVGDTVTLFGPIMNYSSKIEIKNARLVSQS